ncbi:MAG: hypothetical protein NVSMB12_13890 [Acidimicrobiales bacterium]
MQHLHLVGFTAELDGLIFSARRGSKSGGFVVALDDRLLDSIREAVRLQTGADVDLDAEERSGEGSPVVAVPELRRLGRVHSVLTPKEIQARLRAGRSVAEVADEAEVDESWILRFASPVLAEQSRIVELALQVPCRANRKGESAAPLAESVAENLIDRGMSLTPDELSGAWSAFHVRDSSWVVRFRYTSRRRAQVAQWAYDQSDSSVVPINRLATDLGYLDPARRKRRLPLPETSDDRVPVTDEGVARITASTRATTRRTRAKVTKRSPARKPAASKRATTKRATTKRPTTKRATTKRATTKRATTKLAPSKRGAAARKAGAPAAVKRVAKKASASKKSALKKLAISVAKSMPAKKAPAKKLAAKKLVAKKAPAKKLAAKKLAAKSTAAKKLAAKPTAVKKPAVKRAAKASPTTVVAGATVSATTAAGSGRRPAVAGLAGETATTPVSRRERPLVAVRAARPAPPLAERVVKLPADYAPAATTGTVVTNGDAGVPLMIVADPAGSVLDVDQAAGNGTESPPTP